MESINVQLVGNWKEIRESLNDFPDHIKKSGIRGQRTAAEAFAKLVKNHILRDDLGLAPKVSDRSKDSRPLIDTQAYVSSIGAFSERGVYYVGVKKYLYEPRTKIPIHILAVILELGNSRITPRPAWTLSYEEFERKGGATKYISDAVMKQLDRIYSPIGFDINY